MGVEFQKAHGPWTLSSAHGRAMSQSKYARSEPTEIAIHVFVLRFNWNRDRWIKG